MKNRTISSLINVDLLQHETMTIKTNRKHAEITRIDDKQKSGPKPVSEQGEILFVTSYPPRECGIATYSQDLIRAINDKFSNSFIIKICALESGELIESYPDEVKYILNTSKASGYEELSTKINNDEHIKILLIQHEFGFYSRQEKAFQQFLNEISKPVVIVFHTVLPNPDAQLKLKLQNIAQACESIVVMTQNSVKILTNDYGVPAQKISVIPHGTHLVPRMSKKALKQKYGLEGRKVLSTFGLLSSGKGFETSIEALPAIIKKCPEVVFLIIGKTHPEVIKEEGEKYRQHLEQMVKDASLQEHVIFINRYVVLADLLEYLQLTDIYLFTANDPNQAVSGTFVYAMSCGCPIISTPIPHAKELLTKDTGIIFDFRNPQQLADAAIKLLGNETLRRHLGLNILQKSVSTAWENSAVEHALLLEKIAGDKITLRYNLPPVNISHLKQMTTQTGIIQFAKINRPDITTGYTLDDNARALVASCMYFEVTGGKPIVSLIAKYLRFIKFCQQPAGNFLNYVDRDLKFTSQNEAVNLDDSNGRAIWALGYLTSLKGLLPGMIISDAELIIEKSLDHFESVTSTRAMAFAVKGLYYYQSATKTQRNVDLIKTFANRLVQMYRHESGAKWEWFEGYLTYANSTLPEAMLYAWLLTKDPVYKEIARKSFDFLLSHTFNENGIEVISNRHWLKRGGEAGNFGEQPIDVAYTIMTLGKFYDVFMDDDYRVKMVTAFNWFLGSNRLHQIVYNPCTGGCYDGLEDTHVNLNQGAESTVSYLMARFTVARYKNLNI